MHPNIDATFVHADATGLLDLHDPLWELGAGPARNSGNLLWILAIRAQAKTDGIATLMTGDSGNLFFSAEGPLWLVDLLRAGRFASAFAEAQAWRRARGIGWPGIARAHVLPYLMPRISSRIRRLRRRPSRLDEWLRASPLRREIASNLDVLKMHSFLDESRIGDRRAHLLDGLRYSATQTESAAALTALSGVETRDPTVDRRVIEVAMRQPEWARRHRGVDRAAVRGAMADRLPAAIVRRTKRGVQLPEWFDLMTAIRSDLAGELDAVEQHPTSRDLIDVARLRSLLNRWPDRSAGADLDITRDYRDALLRALVVSRYLRWFEARGERRKVR
jgi:asparagine synthase (glutamine-hydrolysing)